MDVRERLRRALKDAMKERDKGAVASLRSALAAIDNAEAVDLSRAPKPDAVSEDVAGASAGVGAAEVPRRDLSAAQVDAVLRAVLTEREAAAAQYDDAGQAEAAERLRYEIKILEPFLG